MRPLSLSSFLIISLNWEQEKLTNSFKLSKFRSLAVCTMTLEEQRPLLDRADEEERGDISSNNDVTGQEPKEVVESI